MTNPESGQVLFFFVHAHKTQHLSHHTISLPRLSLKQTQIYAVFFTQTLLNNVTVFVLSKFVHKNTHKLTIKRPIQANFCRNFFDRFLVVETAIVPMYPVVHILVRPKTNCALVSVQNSKIFDYRLPFIYLFYKGTLNRVKLPIDSNHSEQANPLQLHYK